jgi:hypothetical protein
LTANKKGFSGGKALVGGVLTGGVGLLAGTIGSNKIKITCLACGKQFKPGEGRNVSSTELKQSKVFVSSKITGEVNRIVCYVCNTQNFTNHQYCKHCGKELSLKDERINSNERVNLFACPSCKNLSPKDSKFCPHCKTPINFQKQGCFIATACYGDYDAPEVIVLRKYRDEILQQTVGGRTFIKMYYSISPTFAKVIHQSPYLKHIIRQILLKPLISHMENKNTNR